nr:immunoglobulin light chain junction region [Macaca mulatta]
CQQYKTLPWTF